MDTVDLDTERRLYLAKYINDIEALKAQYPREDIKVHRVQTWIRHSFNRRKGDEYRKQTIIYYSLKNKRGVHKYLIKDK